MGVKSKERKINELLIKYYDLIRRIRELEEEKEEVVAELTRETLEYLILKFREGRK